MQNRFGVVYWEFLGMLLYIDLGHVGVIINTIFTNISFLLGEMTC